MGWKILSSLFSLIERYNVESVKNFFQQYKS